jgi:hypothetical protein
LVTIVEVVSAGTNATDTSRGDEYVVLVSFARPVDLTGWTLGNSWGDVYEFGHIVLEPGTGLRLHTGKGTNRPEDLYWGLNYKVWSKGANDVILKDAQGFIIDTYSSQPH